MLMICIQRSKFLIRTIITMYKIYGKMLSWCYGKIGLCMCIMHVYKLMKGNVFIQIEILHWPMWMTRSWQCSAIMKEMRGIFYYNMYMYYIKYIGQQPPYVEVYFSVLCMALSAFSRANAWVWYNTKINVFFWCSALLSLNTCML